ncbi:MAG: multicopper oxidase domain-containing protein [Deltaproteobacteria bacterium]|nr:multicopper oxidase domain-containing protein [Deltaproteobacteria bacterium]
MSVQNPDFTVKRWSVVGMEGMWAKMFDPPTESPDTPDEVTPTNPTPEVLAAAGINNAPSAPNTLQVDLMHGLNVPTWDQRPGGMSFFLIRSADNDAATGTFPGPTLRVPRGSVFHGHTQGHGPPPHTIHWHGIEPTPMNDGVGHCSMEIGQYTYQWQPNFIGSYFYHCHRNTVQHFEFGLYGFLVIEPPDVYFSTHTLGEQACPIGTCRDGKRRTAANVESFAGEFGFEFTGGSITDPDPWTGDLALKFPVDPHAMTVVYDVEAIWVTDDRDSTWSDLASNARATYPKYGSRPGFDDNFHGNWGGGVGPDDFFAFNDFRPDYFYVTGVPVPAHRVDKGGTGVGEIPRDTTIPAALNTGVAGTQVAIKAEVNQTILLRALDAAYACLEYTFPVDIVVIAWDGRALGVPPYGAYNHAYKVPAGTAFRASVARRFDALIRSSTPVHDFAVVKVVNTRGEKGGVNDLNFDVLARTGAGSTIQEGEEVLMEIRIPVDIGGVAPPVVTHTASGTVLDEQGRPMDGVQVLLDPMSLGGGTEPASFVTGADGTFTFPGLHNGMYQLTPVRAGKVFGPPFLRVTIQDADVTGLTFTLSKTAAGCLDAALEDAPATPDTDVGPMIDGTPRPDGKVDLLDVVDIINAGATAM